MEVVGFLKSAAPPLALLRPDGRRQPTRLPVSVYGNRYAADMRSILMNPYCLHSNLTIGPVWMPLPLPFSLSGRDRGLHRQARSSRPKPGGIVRKVPLAPCTISLP